MSNNPYETDQELIIVENRLKLDLRYAAGPYMSKFYDEEMNKDKLWAIRCPQCKVVGLPFIVCPLCHTKLPEYPDNWVELSGKGYLDSWQRIDIPQMDLVGQTVPDPYLMGTSWLDEDLPLTHYISILPHSEEEQRLVRGLRTEVVLKPPEERVGHIHDIKYIKILWDEPPKPD